MGFVPVIKSEWMNGWMHGFKDGLWIYTMHMISEHCSWEQLMWRRRAVLAIANIQLGPLIYSCSKQIKQWAHPKAWQSVETGKRYTYTRILYTMLSKGFYTRVLTISCRRHSGPWPWKRIDMCCSSIKRNGQRKERCTMQAYKGWPKGLINV